MSDEAKQDQTEQQQPPTEEAPPPPQATWEFRNEFRINREMRSVVEATIKVTQTQIDILRRKVEKLQYGS